MKGNSLMIRIQNHITYKQSLDFKFLNRKWLFLYICILSSQLLYSQPYLRESLFPSSGSGYDINGKASFSWTLGDLIIQSGDSNVDGLINGSQFDLEIITSLIKTDPVVQAFPNPAADFISIKFGGRIEREFQIRLFDLEGFLFYKNEVQNYTDNIFRIDLKELKLSSGVWFLIVTNDDQIHHFKFIKI